MDINCPYSPTPSPVLQPQYYLPKASLPPPHPLLATAFIRPPALVILDRTPPPSTSPSPTITRQAANNDIKHRDDAVDDCAEDGADGIDNGHEAGAYGLEDGFDLMKPG